jgi:serum/glucocorticoid-regulated kinase 2
VVTRNFNVILINIHLLDFRYELLYGCTPFGDENTYVTYEKILHNEIVFDGRREISPQAKDLILKLCNKNKDKRLGSKKGLDELLNHEFYSGFDVKKIVNLEVILINK